MSIVEELQAGPAHDNMVALTPSPVPNRSVAQAKFHRTIWRWHFYAGLFSAPIILIAAITGAIYVFRMELQPIIYRSLMVVEPMTSMVPYSDQYQTAMASVAPASELQSVILPPIGKTPTDRATLFRIELPDQENQQLVFVDPYTGKVSGSINRGDEFFSFILEIHRTLFAGPFGRTLVELATCWGIILVITGVYLWWPRNRKSADGVWKPRLRGKAYTALRDLHALPAIYSCLFMLLIMMTGLFFTDYWGRGFRIAAFVANGLPRAFVSPPKSVLPETAGKPNQVSLDDVITTTRNTHRFETHELNIAMPHSETDSFAVSARSPTGPSLIGMVHIDQYSGEVLNVDTAESVPMMTKVLLYALPIHQGSIFGLPTKILAFVSSLILVLISFTGMSMWWKRRPKGTLGIPRRYNDAKVPRGVIGIIVALAILLPAVGISLLLVLVIDWSWQRMVPRPSGTAA